MIVVAAVFIKNHRDEYLWLNRAYEPYGYGLSGGAVEDNESIRQAVVRETIEEIAVELNPANVKTLTYVKSECGKYIIHLYHTTISNDTVININTEHYDYKWRKLNDINDLVLPKNTEIFIDALKKCTNIR